MGTRTRYRRQGRANRRTFAREVAQERIDRGDLLPDARQMFRLARGRRLVGQRKPFRNVIEGGIWL
jgi:hypothetical protein